MFILAADTWVAIVPVITMIISGIFTYIGYVFSNRAKDQDVKLAEKSQEFDGIKLGQEFFKDALSDARQQITELKALNKELRESFDLMEAEYEKTTRANERLTIQAKSLERKIKTLEAELQALREGGNI